MARNESRVGDIDLCVRTERARIFSKQAVRDEYIEWRETELGYAPPRDYRGLLNMFERDALRFIKNRDGRIETLQWDQIPVISLTMKPIVKLVTDGIFQFKSISEAIASAKPIPINKAMEIITQGVPEKPYQTKGVYWESYCESLNNYPEAIRKKVLQRDSYEKHYNDYKKAPNTYEPISRQGE